LLVISEEICYNATYKISGLIEKFHFYSQPRDFKVMEYGVRQKFYVLPSVHFAVLPKTAMSHLIFSLLFLLLVVGQLEAVVLHPDGEPNLSTWTDRPDANVVGRWSSNASFVVIAPNWVATTRHQNTSPATVVITGISYMCHYRTEWTGGSAGNADIRLIRLTKADGSNANLPHYATPYENNDETGKKIVIGGYGNGRGNPIIVNIGGKDYVIGYQWDGSANTTQRWCQNRVDSNGIGTGTYTSDVIEADFDGLGDDNWRPYEGSIAAYDSGGGWFINYNGEWKATGLSRGVSTANASMFRNSSDPRVPAPDLLDAVRISSYAQWIEQIIHTPGDLTEDDWVDFADFAILAKDWLRNDCNTTNNWCNGSDFGPHNGSVDLNDLGVMADNWLTGWVY